MAHQETMAHKEKEGEHRKDREKEKRKKEKRKKMAHRTDRRWGASKSC